MINQFNVKYYKALKEVCVDLTPFHVLIGPNDSGKTSILAAIAALCRSVDMDLTMAFAGKWSDRELVWQQKQHGTVDFHIVNDAIPNGLDYELKVQFRSTGHHATNTYESIDNEAVHGNAAGPREASMVCSHAPDGFTSEGPLYQSIHEVLSGVQTYRWNPRFLALPNAPDSSRRFRMEPSGFGLALCLDDIMGYDRRLFDKLEDRFKSIFPEVEIIQLLPEPAFIAPTDATAEVPLLHPSDGKGIHFRLANGGPSIPASQVSDGMLLILAYLTILHLPEPPRVLLIEEPENGIHPARLREVLTILRDLIEEQDHTQVLMTTHSPYVVDLFAPKEVTLCYKDDEGAVQTRRLSDSKAVCEQMDVFTLGEIWTGDGDKRLLAKVDSEQGDAE